MVPRFSTVSATAVKMNPAVDRNMRTIRVVSAMATRRAGVNIGSAILHRAKAPCKGFASLPLHLLSRGLLGNATGGAGSAATVSSSAEASGETRCRHCFITFATPAELCTHAMHHCFPDDPSEVLRRFPVGAEALDVVRSERLIVVGPASNSHKAHSSVSSRYLDRGLVADVPIARLQLVARRRVATLTSGMSGSVRSFSGGPSYRTEPLIPIPHTEVGEVARAIASGAARYLDCRSERELAGGVVAGSVSIPFPHNGNAEVVEPAEFLLDVDLEGFERDQTIFVGCRSGARSALAAEVLIEAGYEDVRNVEGGILAWVAHGLPIEPFAG